jgi:hypothetical protein
VHFLNADQVARRIAEGAVANPVRLLDGSWTTSALLACTRSKVPSRSLVARRIQPKVPLAIISAMVRRSSSVKPGPTAGGARRMDVLGWPAGPTVIQRIVPCPTSVRTSKPRMSR